MKDFELWYPLFYNRALMHGGVDKAREYFSQFPNLTEEDLDELATTYKSSCAKTGEGGPIISDVLDQFEYPGPADEGVWASFRDRLSAKRTEEQLEDLNRESNTIVRRTPDPGSQKAVSCRGLVVGHIQSGKTTNFEAVAAKLADLDYRMIIVLAGIHNSLRNQTQRRMQDDLVGQDHDGRWFLLTDEHDDFDLVKHKAAQSGRASRTQTAQSYLTSEGKTALLVVKKNATVLRKLHAWLETEETRNALENAKVLVIDDEADQASVETNTIQNLIVDILGLMPRSTYIGYTATPFANVFCSPVKERDLYPRNFIYSLPQPKGYFGPEVLFGRDSLDLDEGEQDEGKDMIRTIPESDEFLLRPRTKEDVDGFSPVMTAELQDAIRWFILATAARWLRENGHVDSSMLIHTSYQTAIHESFVQPVQKVVDDLRDAIEQGSPTVEDALRDLWETETAKVPAAEWDRSAETYEELREVLPAVLDDVRVIVENSASDDRLQYLPDQSNTIIAIGGNTLSRGITLEGLVSSVFLRPTNTYDTLLQMGRWFGFRNGYEDLPRIWMTPQLQRSFRHLSLVEHELRQDIQSYELQGLTPMQAVVRVRTHPALAITAKMGAAKPATVSFSGARLQTRFFRTQDREWLKANNLAGEALIRRAAERAAEEEELTNGGVLYRDVPAAEVLGFLSKYRILEDQSDMQPETIKKYITRCNGLEDPQLLRWNIAVMGGGDKTGELGKLDVGTVNRAPLKDEEAKKTRAEGVDDIKTLMSPQDLLVDVPGMTTAEAKAMTEAERKAFRVDAQESRNEEIRDKGLLLLYPIDKDSAPQSARSKKVREPMEAPETVLGLGLVFPKTNDSDSERDAVQWTHMAVEVPEFPEELPNTEETSEGEE
ncbi:Z1 domain-containing protein [Corynebacterium sphenisci]|uniref:Z1 domain-containing protein n=1 Tax=Corynebacterium sphenisci TaxID=191493 RepID=UPI0026DF770D|nr:Z1 domain-containing protein [Corynebacterium sphenisci]MDO5731322.1 Z1 domain-containing protein [Corynebacterium sphenisci]